jgi:hypothetical protein
MPSLAPFCQAVSEEKIFLTLFLFVYKQEQSNHMFSMNESNDEKKSSIRTGSIN